MTTTTVTNNDNTNNMNDTNDKDDSPAPAVPPPSQTYVDIASRMKQFEQDALKMERLDPTKPYIIRLDGHKFSTFASSFNKPFDHGLHAIMVQVTKDLMKMQWTDATLGYTQSDEITLVFPALVTSSSSTLTATTDTENTDGNNGDHDDHGDDTVEADNSGTTTATTTTTKQQQERTLTFGGRILKMATLAASLCTARFTYWCLRYAQEGTVFTQEKTEKFDRVMQVLNAGTAHFDARIFNVDNDMDCLNNIKWRSNYDSVRNSRMNLSRKYYSAKQLHKLTARESIERLRTEKGVSWEHDCPASFKYGTFVKRVSVEMDAVNPRTNEVVVARRTILEDRSFGIPGFDQKYCDLVMCKTWNDVPDAVLESLLSYNQK